MSTQGNVTGQGMKNAAGGKPRKPEAKPGETKGNNGKGRKLSCKIGQMGEIVFFRPHQTVR